MPSSWFPPPPPLQILSAPLSPNESFLRYLTLPQDNELAIDLRQTAVVIMAHLDRLASPCSPPQCSSPTSHKAPDPPMTSTPPSPPQSTPSPGLAPGVHLPSSAPPFLENS